MYFLLSVGLALVFSIVICWYILLKLIRIPSARVGGLCVGIFSSLQGWLCFGVLCALQCAKNSVGSCRQSHGCLNFSRMSFRVTYNGWRVAAVPVSQNVMFLRSSAYSNVTKCILRRTMPGIAATRCYGLYTPDTKCSYPDQSQLPLRTALRPTPGYLVVTIDFLEPRKAMDFEP